MPSVRCITNEMRAIPYVNRAIAAGDASQKRDLKMTSIRTTIIAIAMATAASAACVGGASAASFFGPNTPENNAKWKCARANSDYHDAQMKVIDNRDAGFRRKRAQKFVENRRFNAGVYTLFQLMFAAEPSSHQLGGAPGCLIQIKVPSTEPLQPAQWRATP